MTWQEKENLYATSRKLMISIAVAHPHCIPLFYHPKVPMIDQSSQQFKISIREDRNHLVKQLHLTEHSLRITQHKHKLASKIQNNQQTKFRQLFSNLNSDNLAENLHKIVYFSEDDNYAFRLLVHTQLLINLLGEQGLGEIELRSVLMVLSRLSFFEEFQIPEDTETVQGFLRLVPMFPKEVVEILSNYIIHQRSCPNVIFHILQSGIIQQLSSQIQNSSGEWQLMMCRFLCAVVSSRPLLELPDLTYINEMILQLYKTSKEEDILEQIFEYLEGYNEIKENEKLAQSLYNLFKVIIEEKTSNIGNLMCFLLFLSKHRLLVEKTLLHSPGFHRILNESLHSLVMRGPYYKMVENTLNHSNVPAFEVLMQGVFEQFLELLPKSPPTEQMCILRISHKYISDLIQLQKTTSLSTPIKNFLQRCLSSTDQHLQKGSLNILESIIGHTDDHHDLKDHFFDLLHSLSLHSNQQISKQAEDILVYLEQ